eukprot:Nitzschia sp. Nitz4//scaffold196_size54656//4010//5261//NITZ4_006629-RA/size54656-augustus-gene-0.32-mRNA-1//1//CDS//3329540396//4713//frame0
MASSTAPSHCISFADIETAAARIHGIAHKTPVLTSKTISAPTGQTFYFKTEALQKTGSFKFRGALNAVLSEMEVHKKKEKQEDLFVVTHSSGNYAQALALAARMASEQPNAPTRVQATIVMPESAPMVKKRAVESYGATIVSVANTNEARESKADELVETTGATLLHPSDNPQVIAGQGTAALELVHQVAEMGGQLDAVICPVGGGGLASGTAMALRGCLGSKVKIILAEPIMVNDAQRSFQSGEWVGHPPNDPLNTVADGLKTTLGPNTWPILRDLVDDIITVSEEDILRATLLVWKRLKVCIEPSSGTAVAVALGEEFQRKYSADQGIQSVGILLSGGNVDILSIASKMKDLGIE